MVSNVQSSMGFVRQCATIVLSMASDWRLDSSSQSFGFSSSHVWMWELDHKESWAPKNLHFPIVMLEKTLRVPWTARRSNQSILKESTLNIHWKDCCWSSNTSATWGKEPTHWKRPWCWERLRAEEGGRGWDGWKASPTQWTWIWANSRWQWRTEKPGVLQAVGSQRVAKRLSNSAVEYDL